MKKRMKYIVLFLILYLLILGASLFHRMIQDKPPSDASEWMKWSEILIEGESIIDGVQDNSIAYLLISSEGRKDYGDYLIIIKNENGNWKRIYENDFEMLKPWKIKLADVDGDGIQEILTAVYKTAHYDLVYKNRMFIFNYEEEVLSKKWTGSQFAGEWKDFYVGNLLNIPGDELIFIEQLEENAEKISIYYWFDFGFLKLAESERYQDITGLLIINDNSLQITYDKKYKKTAVLTVEDGKIVEIDEKE